MSGIPLIISGAPRSGTTLLYNLFDGHPDISWLVTEAYFFEHLFDCGLENEAVFRRLAGADIDALIDGLRDRQAVPLLHRDYQQLFAGTMAIAQTFHIPWSEERFRSELEQLDFSSIDAMWRGLARACLFAMGRDERRFVCIKSPDYGKSAEAGLATVPDARAIVILRDPVRAIDSLKYSRDKRDVKRLTWPTLSIVIGGYIRMFSLIETADPERLRIVRYEDLVDDPRSVMGGIADWLGIERTASLLEPSFLGQSWSGHSTERLTEGIDRSLASRPPRHLTETEQTAIRDVLQEPLRRYGYGGIST